LLVKYQVVEIFHKEIYMNYRKVKLVVGILTTVSLLSACASVSIGSKEGDTPPRIVSAPDNAKSRIWDNPSAFGPVPADKKQAGEQACAAMNSNNMEYTALGYHSRAVGYDGKIFANGGYYCAPK